MCDERNADVLAAAGWDGPTLTVPWGDLPDAPVPAAAELEPDDPCLVTFTSGTAGEPKAVLHGQRYLAGQMLQARHWLDAAPGDLVWCTAASGWSKSARNAFVAPWLRGAAALLHDARFDPQERIELLGRERVDLLCMAPTEYRVIAKRTTLPRLIDLRAAVAAGEPLDPDTLAAWHESTNLWIRDGYGQTETGQLTGMPLGARPAPARWASRSPACTSTSTTASWSPTPRRSRRSSCATSAASRRRTGRGAPATGSRATSRASCTSSAAPTT